MRVRLFTLLLVAANTVLGAAVILRLSQGSQLDFAASDPMPLSATAVPRAMPTFSAFDVIQSGAVFHQSRRFYVAPETPVAEQPAPDYRLVGSMSIPSRPAAAVLMSNQSNARTKVVVGDQLEGWTVVEIGPRSVTMRLGERTAQIGPGGRLQDGGVNVPPGHSIPLGVVHASGSAGAPPRAPPAANSKGDSPPRLYRPPSLE